MKIENNPVKYEVLIEQYSHSILEINPVLRCNNESYFARMVKWPNGGMKIKYNSNANEFQGKLECLVHEMFLIRERRPKLNTQSETDSMCAKVIFTHALTL